MSVDKAKELVNILRQNTFQGKIEHLKDEILRILIMKINRHDPIQQYMIENNKLSLSKNELDSIIQSCGLFYMEYVLKYNIGSHEVNIGTVFDQMISSMRSVEGIIVTHDEENVYFDLKEIIV